MKYTSIHTSIHTSIKWLAVAALSVLLTGCGDEGETTDSTGVDTSTGTGGGGGSTGSPGRLQFSAPSLSINENAGNATITVTRTDGSDGAVSVTVSSINGTATSPADYAAANATVSFAAGDSAAKTITVAIVNDTSDEPDETLRLTLSNPTNSAVLGSTSQVLVTIVDDDISAPDAPRAVLSSEYGALRADWTSVSGATSYRMMKDATGSGSFTQVGADLPASAKTGTITVVPHLEDWVNGRYAIAACNAAGCTQSDSLSPAGLSVPLIGYLKGPTQADYSEFGSATALSADGNTLAVGASYVGDTATPYSGTVYVYTRTDTTWSATPVVLRASNAQNYDRFGDSVAISADGNTLVVGAINEASGTGAESDNSIAGAGAAYIFTRSGTTWTQVAYLKSATPSYSLFGSSVAISPDGGTVAVAAPYRSIPATTLYSVGEVYVFTQSAGSWTRVGPIAPAVPVAYMYFGEGLALSNQGTTLAIGSAGTDVTVGAATAESAGVVHLYGRSGGNWTLSDTITADTPESYASFGTSVSLSHDGATLAVGAPYQYVSAPTPGDPPVQSGAGFIFSVSSGTATLLTRIAAADAGYSAFGQRIALSGNGSALAVAAPGDDSGTAGLGTVRDEAQAESGAAYVFTGTGATWTQRTYIKASNPEMSDRFGSSIAISNDGATLAIGAIDEESGATGLNGNQLDDCNGAQTNCRRGSGAVYLY